MFESPCPYVPTSSYDWTGVTPYVPPPGCSNLPWNPLVFCIDVAFQACTLWMALEMNVQLCFRFKSRKTLYFWSMLIAIWGTLLFSGAELLAHYSNHEVTATVILNVGWVMMVTGFSFVLYSRLHLLKPTDTILRAILAGVIMDAILFHGPTIVSTIIVNVHPTETSVRIYENISFTEIAFSLQETVIASLYIYFFLQYTVEVRDEPKTKAMLRLLVGAECVVLSTDIVLNTLLYTKVYLARIMIQAFMSVLKLKIEFIVLNSLVKYAQHKSQLQNSSISIGWSDVPGSLGNAVTLSLSRKASKIPTSDELRAGNTRDMSWISMGTHEPLSLSPTVRLEVV